MQWRPGPRSCSHDTATNAYATKLLALLQFCHLNKGLSASNLTTANLVMFPNLLKNLWAVNLWALVKHEGQPKFLKLPIYRIHMPESHCSNMMQTHNELDPSAGQCD